MDQKSGLCKRGNCETKSQSSLDVSNFGFTPLGQSHWLIVVCDTCGNVDSFGKGFYSN